MGEEINDPSTAAAERPIFSIRVLQLIQTAQSQHGIRHNDYDRYRQYCSRRLRRLYKGTKFLHGKGRYVKKKLEVPMVTEERHLYIPLINAERAWSYSMIIKNAEEPSGRKRQHAVARLAKAVVWARELARLASETCDAVTVVEAEAYAAWMHGTWLSERKREWDVPLGKYHRAKRLLEELCRVGDFALQKAARQLLEQVEPAMRFCAYQLERQGAPAPGPDALCRLGDGETTATLEQLQVRLAEVAAAAPADAGAGAVSSTSITWRGRSYPVQGDKVAAALIKVGEAQAAVDQSMDADVVDEQLKLHDALLSAYQDVLRIIQQELVVGAAADNEASDSQSLAASLQELSVAVRGLLAAAAVQRYLVQAAALEQRWERTQQRAALGAKKAKGKDKAAKPEEVARVYDTLVGLASEVQEVAGEVGGADAEALMDEGAAQQARFEAHRCFWVAAAALGAEQGDEAYVLFDRVLVLADTAVRKNKECANVDAAAIQTLGALRDRALALRCAAHAEVAAADLAAQEGLAGGVGGLALREGGAPTQEAAGKRLADKFLLANLDRWESYAGEGGREVRLFQVPPPLDSIAARPFVLDTAQTYLRMPPLGHRYAKRAVEKTGTFARLFSGWGSKQ